MRLLVVTQKVDKNDAVLGFFHNWLLKFADNFDNIIAICLEKGECDLPTNVQVLSLGKENQVSRWQYIYKFYRYIWQERKNYDAVFVHMNQEYVLLGGLFWRIFSKKIILWRNHPKGNFLTKLAVFLANVVYCTSLDSFTSKFTKTKLMPVGVDTDLFFRDHNVFRQSKSILFLSRMAPIKNPDVLLEALFILKKRNIFFSASFIGEPLQKHVHFYQQLKDKTKKYGLEQCVNWLPAVPNWKTPEIYNQFEIFINLTDSGSLDKTIFEAMASQALVLTSNSSLSDFLPAIFFIDHNNSADLAKKLENALSLDSSSLNEYGQNFRKYVMEVHSLQFLVDKIKINL